MFINFQEEKGEESTFESSSCNGLSLHLNLLSYAWKKHLALPYLLTGGSQDLNSGKIGINEINSLKESIGDLFLCWQKENSGKEPGGWVDIKKPLSM